MIASLPLNLAACVTADSDDGSGYRLLSPKPATVDYIVANDRKFANDVAANNRQCQKDKACV